MMARAAGAPTAVQLEMVNDFFNRHIRYAEDIALWGQDDYWAAPMQTIRRGAGDSEDYVIAKYASLRGLGIPARQLRLIYVRVRLAATGSGMFRPHMVLGYYPAPNSAPLILGSLVPNILPASERSDLAPVSSFNSRGLRLESASASRGNPIARLSPWRSVVRRMHAHGFLTPNQPTGKEK